VPTAPPGDSRTSVWPASPALPRGGFASAPRLGRRAISIPTSCSFIRRPVYLDGDTPAFSGCEW